MYPFHLCPVPFTFALWGHSPLLVSYLFIDIQGEAVRLHTSLLHLLSLPLNMYVTGLLAYGCIKFLSFLDVNATKLCVWTFCIDLL